MSAPDPPLLISSSYGSSMRSSLNGSTAQSAARGSIERSRSNSSVEPSRQPGSSWPGTALDGGGTVLRREWSNEPKGRIQISFHARDVNLVMGPLDRGPSVPFRVSIDGQPPLGASGSDVDGDGSGVLVQQKMYQLVRQPGLIVDRVFAIEFLDRAAEGFVFTFG